MTMFRKQYKKDFDSIIPDANYVDNMVEGIIEYPKRNRLKKPTRLVAAVVAICLLVGGGFLAKHLTEPTFIMMAYAHDNGDTGVNIEENTSVVLPFGKLSRGERHSYVDETGKTIYGYDAGFEHGGISLVGKNISSVTYTSKQGELQFFDTVLAQKLLNERKNDTNTSNSDEKVELIAIDNSDLTQRGQKITRVFQKELGTKSFNVDWIPWYAIDMASEDKPIDYADFPADIINIEVSFTNGKKITKQVQLSFNSNGDLLAEVIIK